MRRAEFPPCAPRVCARWLAFVTAQGCPPLSHGFAGDCRCPVGCLEVFSRCSLPACVFPRVSQTACFCPASSITHRTPTGHLQDTYRTPTGHLQDTYGTPTGHTYSTLTGHSQGHTFIYTCQHTTHRTPTGHTYTHTLASLREQPLRVFIANPEKKLCASSSVFKRVPKQNAFLFKKVLQWVVRFTLSKPSKGTTPTKNKSHHTHTTTQ